MAAKGVKGSPTSVGEAWYLRAPERRLLLSTLLVAILGFLMLLGARPKDGLEVRFADLAPLLACALAFSVAHAMLVLARFRGDQLLLPVTAMLTVLGLLAQSRMGVFGDSRLDLTEVMLVPLAVTLMVGVALVGREGRYRIGASTVWAWAALSLLILGFVLATGQRFRGAVYGVGFITPTELLKLTMVLFTAAYVDRYLKALSRWRSVFPPLRVLWPLLLVWAAAVLMLLLQRDLGLVLILCITLLAVIGTGTRHPGYPLYGLLLSAAGAAAVLGLFAHGQRRIETWLNPFADPTGAGWQILQGLSGMYAGGLWGEGFSEARPRYTPIAESDFIYAVIAEELGFAGSLLLVCLFALLLVRLLVLAARARTSFGVMVATGVASVLTVQTLLNIGGVTKALPLTGITLPLISHGGSSLLTVFASLGLVLAISDGEPPKARANASTAKRKSARPPSKRSTRRARAGGQA